MNYRIRRGHLSDCATLAAIWEEAVAETHGFLSQEDRDFYSSKLPEYFDRVQLFMFEYTDGGVAGFLGVSGDSLEMLFVRDRGRGVGRALLDFAVKERYVTKTDVNEQNQAAAEFYKSYGFRETGRSDADAEGKPYPVIHLEIESARPKMPHGHPGMGGHPGGHPHGQRGEHPHGAGRHSMGYPHGIGHHHEGGPHGEHGHGHPGSPDHKNSAGSDRREK